MSGGVELSVGRRRSADFPDHWGIPEGSQFSAERRQWIKTNIADDQMAELRAVRAGDPAARQRMAKRANRQAEEEARARADLGSQDPARLLRACQALRRMS